MSLNRRALFPLLAAAPAVLAGARGGPLLLGFSFYGMREIRPSDALEICGRLGYRCVEFALMEGWSAEPKLLSKGDRSTLRQQFIELDVVPGALMEKILLTADDAEHAANLEKIRRAAELAHDLSPTAPPPLETILGGEPERWEELRGPMAERLDDWARVAKETDLTIALKAHVKGAAHLPEHILWLLRQVDRRRIRAVFDYSHFQLRGLDLRGSLRDLLPETVFVHVKDAAGTAAEPRFLMPGEGDVDYAQLATLLREGGYAGGVVVEVSAQIFRRPEYHPIRAAEDAYETLAAYFEAVEESEA